MDLCICWLIIAEFWGVDKKRSILRYLQGPKNLSLKSRRRKPTSFPLCLDSLLSFVPPSART